MVKLLKLIVTYLYFLLMTSAWCFSLLLPLLRLASATLQKKEACTQFFALEKSFKICYVCVKKKINTWVFFLHKFWSFSLGQKVERKPLLSQEWIFMFQFFHSFLSQNIARVDFEETKWMTFNFHTWRLNRKKYLINKFLDLHKLLSFLGVLKPFWIEGWNFS